MLVEVKAMEDKHKAAAESLTIWQDHRDRGILQGTTELWEQRQALLRGLLLPVPAKCLKLTTKVKKEKAA